MKVEKLISLVDAILKRKTQEPRILLWKGYSDRAAEYCWAILTSSHITSLTLEV